MSKEIFNIALSIPASIGLEPQPPSVYSFELKIDRDADHPETNTDAKLQAKALEALQAFQADISRVKTLELNFRTGESYAWDDAGNKLLAGEVSLEKPVTIQEFVRSIGSNLPTNTRWNRLSYLKDAFLEPLRTFDAALFTYTNIELIADSIFSGVYRELFGFNYFEYFTYGLSYGLMAVNLWIDIGMRFKRMYNTPFPYLKRDFALWLFDRKQEVFQPSLASILGNLREFCLTKAIDDPRFQTLADEYEFSLSVAKQLENLHNWSQPFLISALKIIGSRIQKQLRALPQGGRLLIPGGIHKIAGYFPLLYEIEKTADGKGRLNIIDPYANLSRYHLASVKEGEEHIEPVISVELDNFEKLCDVEKFLLPLLELQFKKATVAPDLKQGLRQLNTLVDQTLPRYKLSPETVDILPEALEDHKGFRFLGTYWLRPSMDFLQNSPSTRFCFSELQSIEECLENIIPELTKVHLRIPSADAETIPLRHEPADYFKIAWMVMQQQNPGQSEALKFQLKLNVLKQLIANEMHLLNSIKGDGERQMIQDFINELEREMETYLQTQFARADDAPEKATKDAAHILEIRALKDQLAPIVTQLREIEEGLAKTSRALVIPETVSTTHLGTLQDPQDLINYLSVYQNTTQAGGIELLSKTEIVFDAEQPEVALQTLQGAVKELKALYASPYAQKWSAIDTVAISLLNQLPIPSKEQDIADFWDAIPLEDDQFKAWSTEIATLREYAFKAYISNPSEGMTGARTEAFLRSLCVLAKLAKRNKINNLLAEKADDDLFGLDLSHLELIKNRYFFTATLEQQKAIQQAVEYLTAHFSPHPAVLNIKQLNQPLTCLQSWFTGRTFASSLDKEIPKSFVYAERVRKRISTIDGSFPEAFAFNHTLSAFLNAGTPLPKEFEEYQGTLKTIASLLLCESTEDLEELANYLIRLPENLFVGVEPLELDAQFRALKKVLALYQPIMESKISRIYARVAVYKLEFWVNLLPKFRLEKKALKHRSEILADLGERGYNHSQVTDLRLASIQDLILFSDLSNLTPRGISGWLNKTLHSAQNFLSGNWFSNPETSSYDTHKALVRSYLSRTSPEELKLAFEREPNSSWLLSQLLSGAVVEWYFLAQWAYIVYDFGSIALRSLTNAAYYLIIGLLRHLWRFPEELMFLVEFWIIEGLFSHHRWLGAEAVLKKGDLSVTDGAAWTWQDGYAGAKGPSAEKLQDHRNPIAENIGAPLGGEKLNKWIRQAINLLIRSGANDQGALFHTDDASALADLKGYLLATDKAHETTAQTEQKLLVNMRDFGQRLYALNFTETHQAYLSTLENLSIEKTIELFEAHPALLELPRWQHYFEIRVFGQGKLEERLKENPTLVRSFLRFLNRHLTLGDTRSQLAQSSGEKRLAPEVPYLTYFANRLFPFLCNPTHDAIPSLLNAPRVNKGSLAQAISGITNLFSEISPAQFPEFAALQASCLLGFDELEDYIDLLRAYRALSANDWDRLKKEQTYFSSQQIDTIIATLEELLEVIPDQEVPRRLMQKYFDSAAAGEYPQDAPTIYAYYLAQFSDCFSEDGILSGNGLDEMGDEQFVPLLEAYFLLRDSQALAFSQDATFLSIVNQVIHELLTSTKNRLESTPERRNMLLNKVLDRLQPQHGGVGYTFNWEERGNSYVADEAPWCLNLASGEVVYEGILTTILPASLLNDKHVQELLGTERARAKVQCLESRVDGREARVYSLNHYDVRSKKQFNYRFVQDIKGKVKTYREETVEKNGKNVTVLYQKMSLDPGTIDESLLVEAPEVKALYNTLPTPVLSNHLWVNSETGKECFIESPEEGKRLYEGTMHGPTLYKLRNVQQDPTNNVLLHAWGQNSSLDPILRVASAQDVEILGSNEGTPAKIIFHNFGGKSLTIDQDRKVHPSEDEEFDLSTSQNIPIKGLDKRFHQFIGFEHRQSPAERKAVLLPTFNLVRHNPDMGLEGNLKEATLDSMEGLISKTTTIEQEALKWKKLLHLDSVSGFLKYLGSSAVSLFLRTYLSALYAEESHSPEKGSIQFQKTPDAQLLFLTVDATGRFQAKVEDYPYLAYFFHAMGEYREALYYLKQAENDAPLTEKAKKYLELLNDWEDDRPDAAAIRLHARFLLCRNQLGLMGADLATQSREFNAARFPLALLKLENDVEEYRRFENLINPELRLKDSDHNIHMKLCLQLCEGIQALQADAAPRQPSKPIPARDTTQILPPTDPNIKPEDLSHHLAHSLASAYDQQQSIFESLPVEDSAFRIRAGREIIRNFSTYWAIATNRANKEAAKALAERLQLVMDTDTNIQTARWYLWAACKLNEIDKLPADIRYTLEYEQASLQRPNKIALPILATAVGVYAATLLPAIVLGTGYVIVEALAKSQPLVAFAKWIVIKGVETVNQLSQHAFGAPLLPSVIKGIGVLATGIIVPIAAVGVGMNRFILKPLNRWVFTPLKITPAVIKMYKNAREGVQSSANIYLMPTVLDFKEAMQQPVATTTGQIGSRLYQLLLTLPYQKLLSMFGLGQLRNTKREDNIHTLKDLFERLDESIQEQGLNIPQEHPQKAALEQYNQQIQPPSNRQAEMAAVFQNLAESPLYSWIKPELDKFLGVSDPQVLSSFISKLNSHGFKAAFTDLRRASPGSNSPNNNRFQRFVVNILGVGDLIDNFMLNLSSEVEEEMEGIEGMEDAVQSRYLLQASIRAFITLYNNKDPLIVKIKDLVTKMGSFLGSGPITLPDQLPTLQLSPDLIGDFTSKLISGLPLLAQATLVPLLSPLISFIFESFAQGLLVQYRFRSVSAIQKKLDTMLTAEIKNSKEQIRSIDTLLNYKPVNPEAPKPLVWTGTALNQSIQEWKWEGDSPLADWKEIYVSRTSLSYAQYYHPEHGLQAHVINQFITSFLQQKECEGLNINEEALRSYLKGESAFLPVDPFYESLTLDPKEQQFLLKTVSFTRDYVLERLPGYLLDIKADWVKRLPEDSVWKQRIAQPGKILNEEYSGPHSQESLNERLNALMPGHAFEDAIRDSEPLQTTLARCYAAQSGVSAEELEDFITYVCSKEQLEYTPTYDQAKADLVRTQLTTILPDQLIGKQDYLFGDLRETYLKQAPQTAIETLDERTVNTLFDQMRAQQTEQKLDTPARIALLERERQDTLAAIKLAKTEPPAFEFEVLHTIDGKSALDNMTNAQWILIGKNTLKPLSEKLQAKQEELRQTRDNAQRDIIALINNPERSQLFQAYQELRKLVKMDQETYFEDIIKLWLKGSLHKLLKTHTHLTIQDLEEIGNKVETYLKSKAAHNAAQKALKVVNKTYDIALSPLRDNKKDLLKKGLKEIAASLNTHRVYPENFETRWSRVCLMLEDIKGYFIRQDQIEVFHSIVKDPTKIHQLIMGSGKTDLGNIMILYMVSMGNNLPFWMGPRALYKANRGDLSKMARLLGIEARSFDFERNMPLNPLLIKSTLNDQYRMIREGGFATGTREAAQCTELEFFQAIDDLSEGKFTGRQKAKHEDQLTLFANLLKLWEKRGFRLDDEVDSINNPIDLFVYASGKTHLLGEGNSPIKFEVILSLFQSMIEDPAWKLRLKIKQNAQHNIDESDYFGPKDPADLDAWKEKFRAHVIAEALSVYAVRDVWKSRVERYLKGEDGPRLLAAYPEESVVLDLANLRNALRDPQPLQQFLAERFATTFEKELLLDKNAAETPQFSKLSRSSQLNVQDREELVKYFEGAPEITQCPISLQPASFVFLLDYWMESRFRRGNRRSEKLEPAVLQTLLNHANEVLAPYLKERTLGSIEELLKERERILTWAQENPEDADVVYGELDRLVYESSRYVPPEGAPSIDKNAWKYAAVAKEAINSILFPILKKKGGSSYGFEQLEDQAAGKNGAQRSGEWVIPYSKGEPRKNSEFGNLLERLSYHVLTYLQKGISYEQVATRVLALQKQNLEIRSHDEEIPADSTEPEQEWRALRWGPQPIPLAQVTSRDIQDIVSYFNGENSKTPELFLFDFLRSHLFPNMRLHSDTLESSPANFRSMFKFMSGFSGTIGLIHALPDGINKKEEAGRLGTDGKTIEVLLRKSQKGTDKVVQLTLEDPVETPEEIQLLQAAGTPQERRHLLKMHRLFKILFPKKEEGVAEHPQPANFLVDAGNCLDFVTPEQFATYYTKHCNRPEMRANGQTPIACIFMENGEWKFKRAGDHETFSINQLGQGATLNKLFTLYGEAQCIGAHRDQDPKAWFMLTGDAVTSLEFDLQAAARARGLWAQEQKPLWAIPEETAKLLKKSDGTQPTVLDLLGLYMRNQADFEAKANYKGTSQRIVNLLRSKLRNAIVYAANHAERISLLSFYRPFFIKSMKEDFAVLAQIHTEEDALVVLEKLKAAQITRLEGLQNDFRKVWTNVAAVDEARTAIKDTQKDIETLSNARFASLVVEDYEVACVLRGSTPIVLREWLSGGPQSWGALPPELVRALQKLYRYRILLLNGKKLDTLHTVLTQSNFGALSQGYESAKRTFAKEHPGYRLEGLSEDLLARQLDALENAINEIRDYGLLDATKYPTKVASVENGLGTEAQIEVQAEEEAEQEAEEELQLNQQIEEQRRIASPDFVSTWTDWLPGPLNDANARLSGMLAQYLGDASTNILALQNLFSDAGTYQQALKKLDLRSLYRHMSRMPGTTPQIENLFNPATFADPANHADRILCTPNLFPEINQATPLWPYQKPSYSVLCLYNKALNRYVLILGDANDDACCFEKIIQDYSDPDVHAFVYSLDARGIAREQGKYTDSALIKSKQFRSLMIPILFWHAKSYFSKRAPRGQEVSDYQILDQWLGQCNPMEVWNLHLRANSAFSKTLSKTSTIHSWVKEKIVALKVKLKKRH